MVLNVEPFDVEPCNSVYLSEGVEAKNSELSREFLRNPVS